MSGEPHIIDFGGSEGAKPEKRNEHLDSVADDVLELDASQQYTEWEEELALAKAAEFGRFSWVPAAIAVILVIGWTGFFLWANQAEILGWPSADRASTLLSSWALPVLLISVVYLLFMRNSRRETARYGEAARLIADESALLETRLATMNRELSLAREFIAAQSRDLEALGRIASERLSRNAERLEELVRDNGTRVETIANVSNSALENMEKLRGQLPVIASSAKDVTNNIGNAGRTAHAQLDDMISGFKRINEFGKSCETQVHLLRGLVDQSIADFDERSGTMADSISARFDALEDRNTQLHALIETREAEAFTSLRSRATELTDELAGARRQLEEAEEACLVSMRARLNAMRDEGGTISRNLREGEERALDGWRSALSQLGENRDKLLENIGDTARKALASAEQRFTEISGKISAFEAELIERNRTQSEALEARRAEAEENSRQALARIGEMSAALDNEMAERISVHERQSAAMAQHAVTISARLEELEERMSAIAERSRESKASLEDSLNSIADGLGQSQSTLAETSQDITQLTDASVRLLELIQASTEQTRNSLPEALGKSDEKLTELESRIDAMGGALLQASGKGSTLVRQIETTVVGLKAALNEIERLQLSIRTHNGEQQESLNGLIKSLEDMEVQANKLSRQARTELTEAIAQLTDSAEEAVSSISEKSAASVSKVAEQLGIESAEAIDKAMQSKAAEAAGQLEAAAAHAASVGRDATIQLRDQLVKVNELIKNLELRVEQARERAEEKADNDFARRAALITESLNSNAIDIAKALSSDVTDTAWAGYLKGDRGIFTRRAVSLIDASDAKAIQQVFERDPDFREHVSRYIHDFEAILRQVLSTRDGNALGVTLLSSDMGKLYVALAQAIERLRN